MTGSDKRFDATKKRVVSLRQEPELYRLAEAALTDPKARGMFVYEGKLWMVAIRAVGERLTIWPELTQESLPT